MSFSLLSRGSIQTVSIILISTLVVAVGGYFGYQYYLTLDVPKEIVVENITPSPLPEPEKKIVIATSSNDVLVTGVIGEAIMVTASWNILLENEKVVSMDNSTLFTTADSRMVLIFSDRSLVRLDANTRISLQKSKEGNVVISLQSGRLWARVIGEAGWKWKLVISLGTSKAIIQGTSLEAVKLPLFSKYTVLDSSAMSWSESSGIDVIDSSGVTTHVLPESKWTSSEFGNSTIKPINVEEVYKNNPFILKNTQEDIVHLRDAITHFSGSIDLDKAQKEILASVPKLWTEESIEFFSGTSISAADLSGEISSQKWGLISEKILDERKETYAMKMKQNDAYLSQIAMDQEKIRGAIMKTNGKALEQTEEMMESIVREQDVFFSNSMMQNQDFIQKINQDLSTIISNQEQLTAWILQDTMKIVDISLKNSFNWADYSSSESIERNIPDTLESTGAEKDDIEKDDFFTKENNNEEKSDDNKKNQMNMGNWTMSNGWNSINNGDASGMIKGSSEDIDSIGTIGTMNNGTSQDSEKDIGSNSMNMNGNSMSNGSDGGMRMGN